MEGIKKGFFKRTLEKIKDSDWVGTINVKVLSSFGREDFDMDECKKVVDDVLQRGREKGDAVFNERLSYLKKALSSHIDKAYFSAGVSEDKRAHAKKEGASALYGVAAVAGAAGGMPELTGAAVVGQATPRSENAQERYRGSMNHDLKRAINMGVLLDFIQKEYPEPETTP